MLSPEKLKQIDLKLNNLTDEELLRVRESLYELGGIIFDDWLGNEASSKYPVGVLRRFKEGTKLNKLWSDKNQKLE